MGLVNITRPVLFGVKITTGGQYMWVALTLFFLDIPDSAQYFKFQVRAESEGHPGG